MNLVLLRQQKADMVSFRPAQSGLKGVSQRQVGSKDVSCCVERPEKKRKTRTINVRWNKLDLSIPDHIHLEVIGMIPITLTTQLQSGCQLWTVLLSSVQKDIVKLAVVERTFWNWRMDLVVKGLGLKRRPLPAVCA